MKKTKVPKKSGGSRPAGGASKRERPEAVVREPVPAQAVDCVKLGPSDAEFVEEWLVEQGLKESKRWSEFFGDYDKEFCKVRLKDGTYAGPCWPNAGKFVRLEDEAEIPAADVTHVSYYASRHDLRERGEHGGGDDDSGD